MLVWLALQSVLFPSANVHTSSRDTTKSSAGLTVDGVELDEATGRPRPPQEVRDADRRLVVAASSAEIEF